MKTIYKKILLIIGITLVLYQGASAQMIPSESVVKFRVVHAHDGYRAGGSFRLLYELRFKEGWHGQSHTPSMEGLIPTTLKISAENGIAGGRVFYPKGQMVKFDFADRLLSTYVDKVYLGVTIAVPPGVEPGEYPLTASLRIQACNDKSCLMPSDIVDTTPLKIVADAAPIADINTNIYKDNKAIFEEIPLTNSRQGGTQGIGDYLSGNGLLLTFIFIFLGGLALNLTPCVYPLIPITVSYFGGQSESKGGRLVTHALIYLLGMATMYSFLGLFAAMTGSMFGDLLRHWSAVLIVSLILVALAMSMFGFYDIRPPAALAQIGGKNRKGLVGTYMMGLTVGIIAAPCIGPFVVGLLAFVGERGDPLLGFTMFFVLAIGLGLPYVALAIFSGSISTIPSSGMWMVWVKKVFGFVLLGMALYFMKTLIADNLYPYIFGLFMVVAGVYLGFLSRLKSQGVKFKITQSVIGLIFIGVGAMFLYPSGVEKTGASVKWTNATQAALAKASAEGRPVIIDFSADWCIPCKELEHFTFSDSKVVEQANKIDMLLADLTTSGLPEVDRLKKLYKVLGVPTIVFLDKNGNERADLRFVGFVDANEFLSKMTALAQ